MTKHAAITDTFLAQCAPEPNTGCWLWLGTIDAYGYGRFYSAGLPSKAHRAAFELFRGQIPVIEDTGVHGACVLHSCDVRSCVNPDHLYVGTQTDNMRDMITRGRSVGVPRGEKHPHAKLKARDIRRIRRLHAAGQSYNAIGRCFGVNHGSIQHIIAGRSWRHVK